MLLWLPCLIIGVCVAIYGVKAKDPLPWIWCVTIADLGFVPALVLLVRYSNEWADRRWFKRTFCSGAENAETQA